MLFGGYEDSLDFKSAIKAGILYLHLQELSYLVRSGGKKENGRKTIDVN